MVTRADASSDAAAEMPIVNSRLALGETALVGVNAKAVAQARF